MSKTIQTPDLYRVEAEVVVAAVACTYCGVGVDEPCEESFRRALRPHAQRWWDYWNAMHGRAEQIPVYFRGGGRA